MTFIFHSAQWNYSVIYVNVYFSDFLYDSCATGNTRTTNSTQIIIQIIELFNTVLMWEVRLMNTGRSRPQ